MVSLGRRDEQYPDWIWVVSPTGKEGWAPESLIRRDSAESGVVTCAYTARELDTQVGELLICRDEQAGWLWAENEKCESGWVPKETLRAT